MVNISHRVPQDNRRVVNHRERYSGSTQFYRDHFSSGINTFVAGIKPFRQKENGRKGLLPSALCLPLHARGPLLFRLLHGRFGAAAAVEEQQIPRVLVKIALAGLEHGDHVFLRLILGVNLL